MEIDTYESVLYKILNAPVRSYPFDHLYIPQVFSKEYYDALLCHLPETAHYKPIADLGRVSKGGYPDRFLFPINEESVSTLHSEKKMFWESFIKLFMRDEFKRVLLHPFVEDVDAFLGGKPENYTWAIDLVRDRTNYAIGPHTDHPQKVVTFLFYLPEEDRFPDIGTALFVPNDPHLTDPQGKHYPFDQFKLIQTMPFLPNSAFGFLRTDSSWHGVAPVKHLVERNTLTFQLLCNKFNF